MANVQYFVSYARVDGDFALKLAQDLRAAGVNLWLDQLDILGGERWDHAIEKALAECGAMIAVLSPESLASNNVLDEISYALEASKTVVPLLLRPCAIPFRLRRVQHVNFVSSYGSGLSHLLRSLHISAEANRGAQPALESRVSSIRDPRAIHAESMQEDATPSPAVES